MFGLGAPELLLIIAILFAIIVLPVAAIAVILIIINAQHRSSSPNPVQSTHQMNSGSQHEKPSLMAQSQQRFCTSCGSALQVRAQFCAHCGHKLSE